MKVKVFAKINLTLSVGAKCGRFHPIDSLVTSVDVSDTVEVMAREDDAIDLSCDADIVTEQNSAYRAAVAFQNAFATKGVSISVRKEIPLGAGMGGSSADAAAVVYCMCKLFDVDISSVEVHSLCADLGSDVNFMLRGGFARMRGKGDDITFASAAKRMYFALTTFNVQLSAADVYYRFDVVSSQISRFANDLENAARSIDGYAEDYLKFAESVGYSP